VIVGAAVGLVLLVVLVAAAIRLGDEDDGDQSEVFTEAPPQTTPAEEPQTTEGPLVFADRTFTIEGVGPIERFPEDCVGTTCSEPLAGNQYLQVSFTVDPAAGGPDPELDQLANELQLQYEGGGLGDGIAFATAWSIGPDTFDAVFEVPTEASGFLLVWSDGSVIDLDAVG
jgi:hypothetical protein